VVICGVVAAIHIRATTIWYDEALTLLVTSGHGKLEWQMGMQQFRPTANLAKILAQLYTYDTHPPLYFWTLGLWRVALGGSLEVARWLSAVFTLGTLVLLYRYAVAAGMRWACFPPIIYALSAAGLRYAYNARPYGMAAFLIVLTLYLTKKQSRWAGISGAACVATHYFAALCAGPILAVGIVVNWRTNRRWCLWTAGLFAAFCLPLLQLVAKHLNARQGQFPPLGVFRKEVDAMLFAAVKGALPGTSIWPAWAAVMIFAVLVAGAGAWWALRKKEYLVPFSYAGFLAGFLLLSVVTHKSIAHMPNDYYLGVAAPLMALLMGFGASAYPILSPMLGLALLAGTVTSEPMMMPPTRIREVVQEIHGQCSDCAVVAGGPAIPACVLYEADRLGAWDMNVYLLGEGETAEELARRVESKTVYLVPSDEPDVAAAEKRIVETVPAEARSGYFKITLPVAAGK
jgi:Dolichyl-phosphate-mannose-protein mannosyltransferase